MEILITYFLVSTLIMTLATLFWSLLRGQDPWGHPFGLGPIIKSRKEEKTEEEKPSTEINSEKSDRRNAGRIEFNDDVMKFLADHRDNLKKYIKSISEIKLYSDRISPYREYQRMDGTRSYYKIDLFSYGIPQKQIEKNSKYLNNFLTVLSLVGATKVIKDIRRTIPNYEVTDEELLSALKSSRSFISEVRKMLDEAEQILNDVCLD